MKLTKLDNREQMISLKKGEMVLVEWKTGATEFKKGTPVTCHYIHSVTNENELILQKKLNIYFNIDMYLEGKSSAKEAFLVTADEIESAEL